MPSESDRPETDVEPHSLEWFTRLSLTVLAALVMFRVASDRRTFIDGLVTYISLLSYVQGNQPTLKF